MNHNPNFPNVTDRVMSRRLLIKQGAKFATAAMIPIPIVGCDRAAEQGPKLVCAKFENLSGEAKELQSAFHYVDNYPDKEQRCSDCAFFTDIQERTCGNCTVLGVAKSMGHCDAFSERTSL
jgi:hypothetical protein